MRLLYTVNQLYLELTQQMQYRQRYNTLQIEEFHIPTSNANMDDDDVESLCKFIASGFIEDLVVVSVDQHQTEKLAQAINRMTKPVNILIADIPLKYNLETFRDKQRSHFHREI